jgi:hypothetical protein
LGGAGDAAPTPEAGAPQAAPGTPGEARPRPPRRRHRGPRPITGTPGEAGAPREGRPDRRGEGGRGPRPPRGDGDRQGQGPRDRDRRAAGPGRDGPRRDGPRRDGPGGRGRDRDGRGRGEPKRVERKLYTIDSVVDRGFEDIEEEAGSRRVNWTIVKRTVADQITRKPTSQSYVLQRDGVDSEFPNLGAARNAVNKTIVHPEKLTRSKAEHVAQKSGR